MIRVESPYPEHAVPRIWSWIQGFRWRVADDYGPRTLEEFLAHWRAAEAAGQRSWGVWRAEELGGLVTARPVNPVTVESHCLFKRSFWGAETTREALRQVYSRLFGDGVEKIVGCAFADNTQLLGLVRGLGFRKEGLLRRQTRRRGRAVDMMAIGLLREDFERAAGMVAAEEAA